MSSSSIYFRCSTQVRSTSHKPDEIYGMIERLSPGTRKIELFGRPHNVQPNWYDSYFLRSSNRLAKEKRQMIFRIVCSVCWNLPLWIFLLSPFHCRVTLGNQLDGIHLLDPEVVARFKKRYPDGVISKP